MTTLTLKQKLKKKIESIENLIDFHKSEFEFSGEEKTKNRIKELKSQLELLKSLL
jgi:hypothetical protein